LPGEGADIAVKSEAFRLKLWVSPVWRRGREPLNLTTRLKRFARKRYLTVDFRN